ncbi:hypothetical protein [Novosphingobium sp. Gsoil 351]|uniref:hypothetical protein n=1 Tax=Novosphingobium sp. Gsoil 351 TaxID=2675225 RepID=UPI0012B486EA|nr:hypothetical protein [Novosphingobium sp. Gsoil 351]QGN53556.1 hypothetical protein GKE62_02330 [Novosphingobium sp. Gsoil 351]
MLAVTALLAACGPDKTAAQKRAEDDRAIAQVKAAQEIKPPPKPIDPQPILFGDIQKFDLFGAGCAFAPGSSMGAVLLTREKVAYLLLDGHPVRFASDPGSAKLPLGTFSRYVGKEMALSLTRTDNVADEVTRWPGHLLVTDPYDQVVYQADGQVQCGA